MQVLYPCCAGADVHKDRVWVCVRRVSPNGRVTKVVREFGTTTRELLAGADWLEEAGVTHLAMESTGVYWKPIWNLLEGRFELLLCNARHVKQVPGRKTDAKDCEWLADLLQHGLLKASFVPPQPLRELRELTRQRTQLTHERTAVVNRLQKILEDANVKLASVASDVVGKSGRAILEAIVAGVQDAPALAHLARGRLIKKIPQLTEALEGRVTDHHRFLLETQLERLGQLETMIERYTARIEQGLHSEALHDLTEGAEAALPFPAAVRRLKTIPGVDQRTAEYLVAEVGTDMSRFPTASHLASWAGLCPGNHESAGKRRSGRTTQGNRWLRRALTQAAWAASHTKDTYLSALYRRLAARRGKKRAIIALAHSILQASYYMLSRDTDYQDLGAQHFDQRHPEQLKRNLVRRLQSLGYTVSLTQEAAAA
jgi:transposase